MAQQKDSRPYMGDAGRPVFKPGIVLLALFVGFVIGMVTFGLMNLSIWLTALVWEGVGSRLNIPLFPLITCTVGGIIIGIWTHLSHNTIDDLETVMGKFKKLGSYRLPNPPATAVSFLLPLAFGGSVGFEAGLTGIICAGCCWIRDKLKLAGLRAAGIVDVTIAASLSAIFRAPLAGLVAGYESENDNALQTELGNVDDYNMRQQAKLVLYLAAALGAFGGMAAFSALFGTSGGLPRFEHIEAHGTDLLWALPCLAAAWILLLVFEASKSLSSLLARCIDQSRVGDIVKPTIAGIALGAIALALPFVLFPGEEQSQELMRAWQEMGALTLIVTGLMKAVATPMCIHMGWRGGDLFPCIFCGVACGYGLASITGADPMLMVTVTTTAFLAGVTRKPLLTLGILCLCFPLDGILWMGIAAVIGSVLPTPHRT